LLLAPDPRYARRREVQIHPGSGQPPRRDVEGL